MTENAWRPPTLYGGNARGCGGGDDDDVRRDDSNSSDVGGDVDGINGNGGGGGGGIDGGGSGAHHTVAAPARDFPATAANNAPPNVVGHDRREHPTKRMGNGGNKYTCQTDARGEGNRIVTKTQCFQHQRLVVRRRGCFRRKLKRYSPLSSIDQCRGIDRTERRVRRTQRLWR